MKRISLLALPVLLLIAISSFQAPHGTPNIPRNSTDTLTISGMVSLNQQNKSLGIDTLYAIAQGRHRKKGEPEPPREPLGKAHIKDGEKFSITLTTPKQLISLKDVPWDDHLTASNLNARIAVVTLVLGEPNDPATEYLRTAYLFDKDSYDSSEISFAYISEDATITMIDKEDSQKRMIVSLKKGWNIWSHNPEHSTMLQSIPSGCVLK